MGSESGFTGSIIEELPSYDIQGDHMEDENAST